MRILALTLGDNITNETNDVGIESRDDLLKILFDIGTKYCGTYSSFINLYMILVKIIPVDCLLYIQTTAVL